MVQVEVQQAFPREGEEAGVAAVDFGREVVEG